MNQDTQDTEPLGGVAKLQGAGVKASAGSVVGVAKPGSKAKINTVQSISERISHLPAGLFTPLLLAVLVLGAVFLSGPISIFIDQQNQIRDYEASVKNALAEVEKAEQAKKQWQDPTFVRAQARERLYFVMPGETQIGVVKDVRIPADPTQASSSEVVKKASQWRETLIASLIQAGTAK